AESGVMNLSEARMERKARRLVLRAGLMAKKSKRPYSVDNFGKFMLIDRREHYVVAGSRYDLTAEEVIEISRERFGQLIVAARRYEGNGLTPNNRRVVARRFGADGRILPDEIH